MVLALKKMELSGYSLAVNTSLFTEETLECIVPDACPDILRILKTDAIICIKSKEVREGRLEIRGGIQTQILYIPEEDKEICRMEVSLPLSVCMALILKGNASINLLRKSIELYVLCSSYISLNVYLVHSSTAVY